MAKRSIHSLVGILLCSGHWPDNPFFSSCFRLEPPGLPSLQRKRESPERNSTRLTTRIKRTSLSSRASPSPTAPYPAGRRPRRGYRRTKPCPRRRATTLPLSRNKLARTSSTLARGPREKTSSFGDVDGDAVGNVSSSLLSCIWSPALSVSTLFSGRSSKA